MDTPLDNPVIKDSDELDKQFLEAAQHADRGEDIPANLLSGEQTDPPPVTEKKEEGGPDNSETDPDKKDDRPRDEMGRFTKTKEGQDIPESERKLEEKPADQKPASEFEAKKQEQKKKEDERKNRSWEAINRQKDEIEQARAELEQQRQQLSQQFQQRQVQPVRREFSSRDLLAAYQDFKARGKAALKDGDYDTFNENEQLAEKSMEHAQQLHQIEQREAQQMHLAQYQQVWQTHMEQAIKVDPEVIKPDAPLAKAVHSILETHGQIFWMIPDGFAKAVEIAKMRLEAGSASELREANKKLQTEVERLNGLTGIGGSGPTSQPAPKKFEELSPEEADKKLLAAAQAYDNGQT